MARTAQEGRNRRAIALDPDKLGKLAGAVAATIVLVVGLFLRQMDFFTAVLRAGVAFIGAYAAVFLGVSVAKRVTLAEVARQREEERRRILSQRKSEDTDQGG